VLIKAEKLTRTRPHTKTACKATASGTEGAIAFHHRLIGHVRFHALRVLALHLKPPVTHIETLGQHEAQVIQEKAALRLDAMGNEHHLGAYELVTGGTPAVDSWTCFTDGETLNSLFNLHAPPRTSSPLP
jgi:hypothetical protein